MNLNIASNNNWCESTNDSVMHYKDGISNGELSGLWVTWDTNYLYVAIQGQAKGRGNNIMCFLDTNVERGVVDQSTMTWNRRIIFADGFRPNAYVGMWCANEVAHFNGTSAGGDAQLFYYTTGWMMFKNGLTPSSTLCLVQWKQPDRSRPAAVHVQSSLWHTYNTEAVPTGLLSVCGSLQLQLSDSGSLVYTPCENEFCTNTGS